VEIPNGSGKVVNYFIITRDRPDLLRECLTSLGEGHESRLGRIGGRIYVIDDSTSSGFRTAVGSACCREKYKLPVFYLGQASYAELIQEVEDRTGMSPACLRALMGSLGCAGWNVHAARNFGFLFARAHLRETPLYCFLDDDIRLTPASYLDRYFAPDALDIISDNLDVLCSTRPVALGSSFVGRQDVTLSRHVELRSREVLQCAGSGFPHLNHGFPMAVATTCDKIDEFDDIPSAGFLVANYAALAFAHSGGFYNQDWLWARLVASEPRAVVARLKAVALHIGPARACSRQMILAQEIGEIFYDALTDSLLQKPDGEESVRFVRQQLGERALKLAAEDHMAVLCGRVTTIGNAVAALNQSGDKRLVPARRALKTYGKGIGEAIQSLSGGEYARHLPRFQAYLDQVPVWRRIVPEQTSSHHPWLSAVRPPHRDQRRCG